MINKNFIDPSQSQDEEMLQNFSNHLESSGLFQELIKVESDSQLHYHHRSDMHPEPHSSFPEGEDSRRRIKGRSKDKKKVFYRDKMAELMKPGEYVKPEYKYTANAQQDLSGRLSKEEQLKRNRQSAKNSRQRKKEYVTTLAGIVQDQKRQIQELTDKLEQVTQERDRLRNFNQDEIKNFDRSKAMAYEELEVALKEVEAPTAGLKDIIQDMMHKFGTSGSERMRVVNYYMNEIIEVLISDLHKYFLNCSVFGQRYVNPNQEKKPIDTEVMRILNLDSSKLSGMIGRYKDRFLQEATVFKDLTQELYRVFKSIESKGKAIDYIFADMVKEIDVKSLGELIHWFEENRFLPHVKKVRTEWTKLLKTGEENFEVLRKQMKHE